MPRGMTKDLPKTAGPASLWGKDAVHQFDAFNPDTGKRLSMKVTDLGEEVLTRHGVPRRTHHYKIADTLTGEFAREVWFDGDALVRTKISARLTEIRKWRAETGARNLPRKGRNTENYRSEAGIRQRNPRECRGFFPTGKYHPGVPTPERINARRIKPFPTSSMKKAATHPAGNSLQDAAKSRTCSRSWDNSRNCLWCYI